MIPGNQEPCMTKQVNKAIMTRSKFKKQISKMDIKRKLLGL